LSEPPTSGGIAFTTPIEKTLNRPAQFGFLNRNNQHVVRVGSVEAVASPASAHEHEPNPAMLPTPLDQDQEERNGRC